MTTEFAPYSDYNFVSLLSWNTDDQVEWSVLRDNLAVRFAGYVAGQGSFYSLLGDNEIDDAVAELIALAARVGCDHALRLVPEIVVAQLTDAGQYHVQEDPDNHDYIYRTADLAACGGADYAAKRKRINRFQRNHGRDAWVDTLDLRDRGTARDVVDVCSAWVDSRSLEREHTRAELEAVQRLLRSARHLDLVGIGVRVDGGLRAFSILEVIGDYAVAHFEKADVEYEGIFQVLKQQVATKLRDLGCSFVNYEQDLGLPGIRREKRSWRPAMYLRKYVVSAEPGP